MNNQIFYHSTPELCDKNYTVFIISATRASSVSRNSSRKPRQPDAELRVHPPRDILKGVIILHPVLRRETGVVVVDDREQMVSVASEPYYRCAFSLDVLLFTDINQVVADIRPGVEEERLEALPNLFLCHNRDQQISFMIFLKLLNWTPSLKHFPACQYCCQRSISSSPRPNTEENIRIFDGQVLQVFVAAVPFGENRMVVHHLGLGFKCTKCVARKQQFC